MFSGSTATSATGFFAAMILDSTVELGAHSRKFSYKLYDERDKFKFSIVNYPDLGGNIAIFSSFVGLGKFEILLNESKMLPKKTYL